MRELAARRIVLAASAAMLLAAVGFWWTFARDVPHGDAWTALVPAAIGKQAIDLAWLFSYHNVHVVPVPRLLFVGLGELTNFDFRALPLLDVLGMGLAAFALVWAVRKLRGETRLTDVTFALLLLHFGHSTNFLGAFRSQYVIAVVLVSLLLVLIARTREGLTTARALMVFACLTALAGCGLNGLAFLPLCALWPLVAARLEGQSWQRAIPAIAFATVAAALLVWYFAKIPEQLLPSDTERDWGAALLRSLSFLGVAVGAVARDANPLVGLTVLLVCVASAIPLLRALREPKDRVCALGLLLFLGGLFALAAAVGWGRTRNQANVARYVTLLAPTLCWAYLAWTLERNRKLARHAQTGIFLVALFVAISDGRAGLSRAEVFASEMDAFATDTRNGLPPQLLANLHVPNRAPGRLQDWISGMRDARLGPYRDLINSDTQARFESIVPIQLPAPTLVELHRTESVSQRVASRPGSRICALHVLFSERSGPRSAVVQYRIDEVSRDGLHTERGHGELTIANRKYYALECEPFLPSTGAMIQLHLTVSGDAKPRTVVQLPLCALSGSETLLELKTEGTTRSMMTGKVVDHSALARAALDAFIEYKPASTEPRRMVEGPGQ